MFRKGTILIRKRVQFSDRSKVIVVPLHQDMIKLKFWEDNPEILEIKPPGTYEIPDNVRSDLIELQLTPKG